MAAALDPDASSGPPGGPPDRHGFARPVPGAITSPYGMRVHPVLHVRKLHDGTDFGAACGTPIRAPYAGTVTGASSNAGYGNRLFLDHGTVDGHRVRTAYNHALRYVVGPGRHVRQGQLLGYVGSTGFSTGCHLHLMLWLDGRMVDPMSWL
jgi:murein DD-endopeptidase MepM/ murein hydrolase activator NlpD